MRLFLNIELYALLLCFMRTYSGLILTMRMRLLQVLRCCWLNVSLFCGVMVGMGKIRLYVHVRKQGAYVASVPVRRLIELSGYPKKRWRFEDGWLILEAF
jgi:hypothetical protein